MEVRTRNLADLSADPRNARTHDERNIAAIMRSLDRFGQRKNIVVYGPGRVIAGSGTLEAAKRLGWDTIEAADFEGSEEEAQAYAIADNRTAELATWDDKELTNTLLDLSKIDHDLTLSTGFSDRDLARLVAKLTPDPEDGTTPDLPAEPITQRGDLWLLGDHRLICGDCTSVEQVARLLDGAEVDLMCTDPPYCSGGFQESGKAAGSVGTTAVHKQVANDKLSTRGYTALLRQAFANVRAKHLYCFTDWRMWVHLFDVAESSGYCVRSMIVWDKGTPGMGRGWRSQHELILWGCKNTPPFDKHASGQGNVIPAMRSGNKHHTTEKPLEVLSVLLGNVPFAQVVADPFAGAGTTLIACEQHGRRFLGMELDPGYCDVTVERWEQHTGKKAQREIR